MGDAINWEWTLQCAKESSRNIVIVSRDNDYGFESGNERILHDCLAAEFRALIGPGSSVMLTGELTEAFRQAGINVTPEEERAEKEVAKHSASALLYAPGSAVVFTPAGLVHEDLRQFFVNLGSAITYGTPEDDKPKQP